MARFILESNTLGNVAVEAPTMEAAKSRWLGFEVWEQEALRETYVSDLNQQQRRLGLDNEQVANMEAAAVGAQYEGGNQGMDMHGLFDTVPGPEAGDSRFLLGLKNDLTRRGRGLQQMILGYANNQDAADALAVLDAEERVVFDIIDSEAAGIGMEDLGEAFPTAVAFLGAGMFFGLPGIVVAGVMLGYADLVGEGEGRGTRQFNAVVQGASTLVLPAGSKALGAAGSALSKVSVGVKAQIAKIPMFFRTKAVNSKPGTVKNATDEAIQMTESANGGVRRLGEVVLDRINGIVNNTKPLAGRAPPKGASKYVFEAFTTRKVANEKTMGMIQNTINKATVLDGTGPRLDFGVWSKSLANKAQELKGALPKDSARALNDIIRWSSNVARAEGTMPAKQAYELAAVVMDAPLRYAPLMAALARATKPDVQAALVTRIMAGTKDMLRGAPGLAFQVTTKVIPQQIVIEREDEVRRAGQALAEILGVVDDVRPR